MTTLLLSLFLGCATPAQATACHDTARTMADISGCEQEEAREADKALNAAYKELMAKYADDSLFRAKLKKAQRAWITYRDLELELIDSGGSIASMCRGIRFAELSKERASYLKSLAEKEEGDVCAP